MHAWQIHTVLYIRAYMHTYAHAYIYILTYLPTYVRTYVRVYGCIYIYTHIMMIYTYTLASCRGVFCNSAIKGAEKDQEMATQALE